jgi:hypothetical protein
LVSPVSPPRSPLRSAPSSIRVSPTPSTSGRRPGALLSCRGNPVGHQALCGSVVLRQRMRPAIMGGQIARLPASVSGTGL